MREQWAICPIAPQYEVSTWGRVRHTETGHIRKTQRNPAGYPDIAIWDKQIKKQRRLLVHRMVAVTFIPNPHNYSEVNHIDGNKTNNNITNLEWVDHLTNMIHSVKELGNNRKFTDKQIEEILQDYVPYAKQNEPGSTVWLANKYGVRVEAIYRVTNGNTCVTDKSANRPKLTPEDMDSIIARYTPFNIKSIMAEYNMSVQTFYKWILPLKGLTIKQLKEKYYINLISEVEYRKSKGELYRDILPQYHIAHTTYVSCKKKYGNKMN